MAQVLITDDAGKVLFDGSVSNDFASELAGEIKTQYMGQEWMDVSEEEIGEETEQRFQEIQQPEQGWKEVPRGMPVIQRRRLKSAVLRLASALEEMEKIIEGTPEEGQRRRPRARPRK